MLNSRDIDRLRPDVAANCRAWLELCRAAGLLVLVTGTVRDEEYQQYCFENGTAATPTSARTLRDRSIRIPRSFSGPESWGSRWALSGAAGGRASLTGPISSGATAENTPAA